MRGCAVLQFYFRIILTSHYNIDRPMLGPFFRPSVLEATCPGSEVGRQPPYYTEKQMVAFSHFLSNISCTYTPDTKFTGVDGNHRYQCTIPTRFFFGVLYLVLRISSVCIIFTFTFWDIFRVSNAIGFRRILKCLHFKYNSCQFW